jgi:uncharacterized protein YggE
MRIGRRSLVVAALVVSVFVAGLSFRALTASPRPAAAATVDDPTYRTISVTGQGEIRVAPTICRLVVGVISDGKTAQEAQTANNKAVQAVTTALRTLGILPKDLQTVGFNLHPIYSEASKDSREYVAPQVVGYRASHRVMVTVRELDKVGKVIDESVKAGANSADEITYAVEETAELRTQALSQAVRQARQKADAIAGAAGLVIAEIRQIQEHYVDFGYYRVPYAYDKALGVGEAAMPTLPGELTIRAAVGMTCRY